MTVKVIDDHRGAHGVEPICAMLPVASATNYEHRAIHRRGPWRSFEAVEYATLKWIEWLNNRRLLEPIGNIPPAEAEADFHATLENEAMAA